MRLLTACLFGVVALALPTVAAPIPKDSPKTTAEKLLGKWKLVKIKGEAPPEGGAIVELTKDGKMTITYTPADQEIVVKGTYKLKGDDKIDYQVTLPDGTDKAEVLTIKKLTDDELVTEDPEGVKEEFQRVKEKKEKK